MRASVWTYPLTPELYLAEKNKTKKAGTTPDTEMVSSAVPVFFIKSAHNLLHLLQSRIGQNRTVIPTIFAMSVIFIFCSLSSYLFCAAVSSRPLFHPFPVLYVQPFAAKSAAAH
jgi:hypothetical protein